MANKSRENVMKGILAGITGFIDAQANKQKLVAELMMNEMKLKQNWLYKLKEMQAEKESKKGYFEKFLEESGGDPAKLKEKFNQISGILPPGGQVEAGGVKLQGEKIEDETTYKKMYGEEYMKNKARNALLPAKMQIKMPSYKDFVAQFSESAESAASGTDMPHPGGANQNPQILERIKQGRAKGYTDTQLAGMLKEVGINPDDYNLK